MNRCIAGKKQGRRGIVLLLVSLIMVLLCACNGGLQGSGTTGSESAESQTPTLQRITGSVKNVSATQISVQTAGEPQPVVFSMSMDTTYKTAQGASTTAEAVQVGQDVEIDYYAPASGGLPTAAIVMLLPTQPGQQTPMHW